MTVDLVYIVFALLLLFLGAESLVKGSTSTALRAGLGRLMVGLTIVVFGTSSPELLVSVKAALSQQGDISVGNVVGSNSFNTGIILGLTALVCPIPVNRQIIKLDAPIALGVALLLPLLLLNHSLGRVEGLLLLAGIVTYIFGCVLFLGAEGTPRIKAMFPYPRSLGTAGHRPCLHSWRPWGSRARAACSTGSKGWRFYLYTVANYSFYGRDKWPRSANGKKEKG